MNQGVSMLSQGSCVEDTPTCAEATKTARKIYEEVLKIKPDHYKARVNLAIILEKQG